MCVCVPPRVLITTCSRVTWHDVHPIHLVKQVHQFYVATVYMTAAVSIVYRYGLRIEACHDKASNV